MKNCFCTVFFLLIISIANAQNNGKIYGIIKDGKTPLEYVTITLAKYNDTSKILFFTSTDSFGRFTFTNIPFATYQIKYSLIGFQNIWNKLNVTTENNSIDVQTIILKNESIQEKTATIIGQKKLIENTAQGFIVNAAANITQLGGTATDILKSTPTITIDADGGISLRGKRPLILINGRNTPISNIDQIAASSIESIEVINNATSKYDANAESGIINIILKKNKQKGTNGAIAIGTGFGAKARANSSIILNHKIKKWNTGLTYDNRFAGRNRVIDGSRTNLNLPNTYLLNQNRKDDRLDQLQEIKFTLDYAPNKKNNFTLEAVGNTEGQDNKEDLTSVLWKQNNQFNNSNDRYSIEKERTKVAEFTLEYNKNFTEKRKSLTANISTSIEKNKQNTDITTQNLDSTKINIGNPQLSRTHSYEKELLTNTNVNYAIPYSKKGIIEMGYKGLFRNLSADYATNDLQSGMYNINNAATNIFNFKEQINALYIMLNTYKGIDEENAKWKLNMGCRVEQVNNSGKLMQNNTNFTNQYLNVFPTASILYFTNNTTFFKLNYAKRINRPDIGQLNPFIDITDALNPHSGNANLKPEIIHALELGYNQEWKNNSFSTNVFYRYNINNIRQFIQLQSNGANLTKPINIGNSITYGIENIFTAKPTKKYAFNFSFSLFHLTLNGSNISNDLVQKAVNYNLKMMHNYSIGKGTKIQCIANYISPLTTPQGKRLAQYNIDLGAQQKIGKGNARLGLSIADVFNSLKTGVKNFTTDFTNYRYSKADTRAIVLTYVYTFKSNFKEKLLDNKFSAE